MMKKCASVHIKDDLQKERQLLVWKLFLAMMLTGMLVIILLFLLAKETYIMKLVLLEMGVVI